MRLAFISDAVWPYHAGGKEKALWELTTRLAERGHDVHIYTMKWWEGPPEVSHGGVSFHAISRHRPLYAGRRRSTAQALWFGAATVRLLWQPFDLLDVDQMPVFPLFAARVVCALRRKPLVGRWHEVWGKEYWRSYLGRAGGVAHLVDRVSLRMPDLILANSEHTARRLAGLVDPTVVRTLPHGVDAAHIDAVRPSADRSDVIFAGRLLANKRVDLLIESVAILRARGRRVRCLIVGDGPERMVLERLAAERVPEGGVEFIDCFDDHDDLMALVKASRVFALPSEREGFGLVVLEANACGVPVVTTDHPANAAQALIVSGVNGLVTASDPEALADGIIGCVDAAAAMRPREALATHFGAYTWDGAASRYAALVAGESAVPVG